MLWGSLDEGTGRHYTTHFFIEDSLEYLVNQMIHSIYPHQYSRGYMPEFPVFFSQEEAEQLLSQDFVAERKKYMYYYFDQKVQKYVCMHANEERIIFTP